MEIRTSKKGFGFTLVEFIAAITIISVLIGTGSWYFKKALKSFREVALKNQLADMRLSLKLYQLFHDKNPDDIRRLLTEEVNIPRYSETILKKKYVESVKTDREGFPIDPFGNRFLYRADVGQIRPQTKGYEGW